MHASEAQHWYTREGDPAYTVKSRDGSDRPATLRDARKLGLVPSVTSIIKCAAAPGLQRWKTEQMMLSALTLPRLDGEPEAAWISRVWTDSGETARKAAEKGTAIHAAIQGHYEGERSFGMEAHIGGAVNAVTEWLGSQPWKAERSFSCPVGFGGKVDLSCSLAVLDFKSKEFSDPETLKTWDEHAMQLAAYRHGLGLHQSRCAIVYVSVTNPGLSRLIEIPEEELQKGWKCFYSLLHFWQAKTGYTSSFARELAA